MLMLNTLCACIAGLVFASCLSSLFCYEEQQAVLYAEFARVAFCRKSAIESWSCGEMCEAVPTPSRVRVLGPGRRWKVQGYVAQMFGGRCVLAFRGSSNTMNWVADMRVVSKKWPPRTRPDWPCPGCRAHAGFVAAFEELRMEILVAVRNFGCRELAVVGHSLGGALATLAAMDLRATSLLKIGHVFTFGCPRVGNRKFVEAFHAVAAEGGYDPPLWRIVHNRDPVPLLSPTIQGLGFLDYQHAAEEIHYNRNSSAFIICKSMTLNREDPACSVRTPKWRMINRDHLVYLNRTFEERVMPTQCTGALHLMKLANLMIMRPTG